MCEGSYVFPNSLNGLLSQYPSSLGPNQVCTLPGATPGTDVIPGSAYLSAAYGYQVSEQWRNWGILVAFFVGVSAIQAALAEVVPDGNSAPQIDVFAHEDKERKELNERLQAKKEAYRKGEVEQDLSGLIQTRKTFTWEDLTCARSSPLLIERSLTPCSSSQLRRTGRRRQPSAPCPRLWIRQAGFVREDHLDLAFRTS